MAAVGERISYRSLEQIATQARPYPVPMLRGAESALVLFAAAFLGHNDAIHFAQQSGLRATCVDTDAERLEEMRALYAKCPGWEFVEADAWTYAEAARREDVTFDVVSLDPFTGDAMERVLQSLELWTALANDVVIVGTDAGIPDDLIPYGWVSWGYVNRSAGAEWLILARSGDDGKWGPG